MYAIPMDVKPSDALLTLSTCLEENRLVVIARRQRDGEQGQPAGRPSTWRCASDSMKGANTWKTEFDSTLNMKRCRGIAWTRWF